jgi:YegS/Rv2252/BmrU family lipid kinase
MAGVEFGRSLIIANPASHSGLGAQAAARVGRFFDCYASLTRGHELVLTEGPGDGRRLAAAAAGFDTVFSLGGDGLAHEVACGLMEVPAESRPRFALVPMGSGNDLARTFHATRNDPDRAIAELVSGKERSMDLGRVNGSYFVQTLSFGMDAAIALDTTRRRAEDATQQGAALFATSGIRLFSSGMRGWEFEATCDGEPLEGIDIVFAVQNGPTYGGGFRVCPDADPADGRLDLCYSVRRPLSATALGLFGLARFGLHIRSSVLAFRDLSRLDVRFPEGRPPCQADGERLDADAYHVSVEPAALRVVVPAACPW